MILVGQITWILFNTLSEEVIFRGMVAREFALRWGWPLATLGSGVFFSVIHMVGLIPILTPVLVVGILVAGLVANALFVLLYVKGRSLALPFGCHFAWNFALAGLIGTTMSGAEQSFGLFRVELAGPLVLTGGEFGVEMSAVGIVISLVVLGVGFRHYYRDQIAILASGAWRPAPFLQGRRDPLPLHAFIRLLRSGGRSVVAPPLDRRRDGEPAGRRGFVVRRHAAPALTPPSQPTPCGTKVNLPTFDISSRRSPHGIQETLSRCHSDPHLAGCGNLYVLLPSCSTAGPGECSSE
jgi:hypothetical protein